MTTAYWDSLLTNRVGRGHVCREGLWLLQVETRLMGVRMG